MMVKRRRGRGLKYTDEFKKQLVAESRASGATVPMICKRHGVASSRIYSWRGDPRFQPDESEAVTFAPVEISDIPDDAKARDAAQDARIEITLENGRRISVSDGADAGFVLELALGLAA